MVREIMVYLVGACLHRISGWGMNKCECKLRKSARFHSAYWKGMNVHSIDIILSYILVYIFNTKNKK